jgi:hypothetical protein
MATSLAALRRHEYYKLIKSPSAHIVQAGITSLTGISRKSFIRSLCVGAMVSALIFLLILKMLDCPANFADDDIWKNLEGSKNE